MAIDYLDDLGSVILNANPRFLTGGMCVNLIDFHLVDRNGTRLDEGDSYSLQLEHASATFLKIQQYSSVVLFWRSAPRSRVAVRGPECF